VDLSKARHRSPTAQRGLSLIEVLIVMAIAAILLGIGVPLFTSTVASARASSAANSLLAAIELARAEALRRGAAVAVCPSADAAGTACGAGAASADWSAGWLVWVDNGGTAGAIDAGEELLLRHLEGGTGSGRRIEINGNASFLRYGPNGLRDADGGGVVALRVSYRDVAAGEPSIQDRCVRVSLLGQARVARGTC
jgi:type IV fimbrial biogenesis protein FimT